MMNAERDLPQRWAWAKLEDVCEKVQDGTHFSPKTQYPDNGPDRVLYLTSKNVRPWGLDLSDVTYVDRATHREIFQRCDPRRGDVLLTKDGVNTGNAAVNSLDEEFSLLSSVALIRPRHSVLDSRFLKYYIDSPWGSEALLGKMTGTAIKRIILKNIKTTPIPIAPLDEQRRIVAKIEELFSRLDAGVAALKRVQAALKRYKASVLKAACEGRLVPTEGDWRDTTLRDVILSIEAGKSFKCEERPPEAHEVGVVKVSSVTWGTFDENESKTCLDPQRIDQRFLIRSGDFLFSRANTIDLVGACVIAGEVTKTLMLSDKILRFAFSPDVIDRWVLIWLRSQFGRSEIENLATGNQESMRNIGQERIRQIKISLPPLHDQRAIVTEVERRFSVVAQLEAMVKANLLRATRLRQSILAKAFGGQLISHS